MTTEIFQFALDINADNDVYVLGRKTNSRLSGAAYVWAGWEPKVETTEKAVSILSHRIQGALPSFDHWLFVGHRNWQTDSKVARHKKLWSTLSAKGINIPDGERVTEVIVANENGIKCFGLIKCNSVVGNSVASILRSGWEAQLIFAEERDALDASKHLISNGWEHKGNAPSDKFIDLISERNIFAYLPLGWFDDRESGCAVIAKDNLIKLAFPECMG